MHLHTSTPVPPCRADRLTFCDICDFVEDAIKAGLLPVTLADFNHKLMVMPAAVAEAYVQDLWDRI